jgi:PKD repeat protein
MDMRKSVVLAAVCLTTVLLGSLAATPAQAGLASVWAVDDGEKILRDNLTSPLKTGNSVWDGSSVSLSGACNEIVAFQLILEADGAGASNVDLSVSNLTNGASGIPGSHPLPAPNNYLGVGVELFTEHYLHVDPLSGDPTTGYFNWSASAAPSVSGMTTGWMPDALVPFSATPGKGGAPFTIAANTNQGVWVDIYIAKGLPAGSYTGTITITLNGVPDRTIPISLQVLDFTLPDENHYKTMIYYSDYCIDPRYNLTYGAQWPMMREFNKMAHRHRLDLIGAGTWDEINNLPGVISGAAYTSAYNYQGPGEGVGNSLFSICTYGVTWTDTEAAYRTQSDQWVNWFDANAPNVDYFLYLIDEPGSSQYSWIQTRAGWIHDNPGPGNRLPVFVTKAVTDALIGSIDIWGSPTAAYDQTATAAARARGEDVWPYAAFRPKSAADVIDDWGIAYRIKPWIAYKAGISRWFTWESSHYIRNPNEINPNSSIDVWTDPLTFHTSSASETGNGDGTMFYPGRDYVFPAQDRGFNGPVSSCRMKMYRRGAQDYEYLWLADQAGRGQEVQNILQDLLPHVMDTAVTVPDWSNSDAPYEQARRELADLLGPPRAPSAKFQASVTRGTSPLLVNFTDLSIFAPTSWSWDFGDSGTSEDQHPSHVYTGSGSFTVSLTASNALGQDTETKSDYITLVEEVLVYPDEWGTWGGQYAARIVSGGLADVQQDDGVYMVTEPASHGQKYSSLFTAHSSYTPDQIARITVEYQAKTSDASQPGSTLLFMRRPDSGYNLVSDGSWKPGLTDTDYTWETTDVGTYLGSDGILGFEMCGCPSSTTPYQLSVDVMRWRLELKPASPVANFTANPTSGPAPLTVYFTDTSTNSPTSWAWTFGDGGTSPAQHPSHQYLTADTYTVSLTATNAYGSDTETKVDYITVTSGGAQDYTCASLTVNIGSVQSGDHTSVHVSDNAYLVIRSAKAAGKQTAQVSYTFTTGLPSLSSLSVTVESKVSAGSQPVTVYAYNYATASWTSIATGTLTTTDSTLNASVPSPGSYLSGGTVQVRVKAGGSGRDVFDHSTDLVKITAAP